MSLRASVGRGDPLKTPLHVIVDGYNVIYALHRFSKGASLEEKRHQLQRAVELFAQSEGMTWTICFDGRESEASQREEDPHLLFSRGEGADAIMERLAYQAKGKEPLLCVTNDRTLRNFLFGVDASVISVDEFEERLKEVEQTLGFS